MTSTLLWEPVMRPLSVKLVPLSCPLVGEGQQAGGFDAEGGRAAEHHRLALRLARDGRRRAQAFAGRARAIDGGNLVGRQGAIVNGQFVNQPIKMTLPLLSRPLARADWRPTW